MTDDVFQAHRSTFDWESDSVRAIEGKIWGKDGDTRRGLRLPVHDVQIPSDCTSEVGILGDLGWE